MVGHVPFHSLAGRRPFAKSGESKANRGFTLVEILVTTAVIALLMVVMSNIVNSTTSTWTYTSSKIEQFRSAREGFESMTRRISQATLNTYWDYDNPNTPTKYLRQSELRFISGPNVAGSSTSNPPRPTHGIFFFAPLGFVVPDSTSDTVATASQGLDNLLNAWGYFVEYADDSPFIPDFAKSAAKSRFRLVELMQSSQDMNIYQLEGAGGGNSKYVDKTWFLSPVNTVTSDSTTRPVHILAENVIALIILPKLSPESLTSGNYTSASLAPQYLYDSTGTGMGTLSDPNLNPTNQLPPVVQVTMVAIDEASALKFGAADATNLNIELGSLFSDPTNLPTDLGATASTTSNSSLSSYLLSHRIHYRIFTSEISIKGAKWSSYQKN